MKNLNLFTSESVSMGHPDKLCDMVSDAVLDACLAQDPYSRVACECYASTNLLIIGGEITTKAVVDFEAIARKTIAEIGYTNIAYGMDAATCEIKVLIKKQSPDISMGVDVGGAGDQGIMFGYATNETKAYMPLPIFLANQLIERATMLRKKGEFKWARPDMKSQVTIDYTYPNNPRINTILMSVQHDDDYNEVEFKKYIFENIMKVIANENNLNDDFTVLINPTGRFVIGGPEGDVGLTGRKIIVDTYGGSARHGGGAFSGKDCTKVDRSAAYAARHIAKNIVAAGLADKCEIQLSYAIGKSEPVSIMLETFNSEHVDHDIILKAINKFFDLTPNGIINRLELRRPIYAKLGSHGHFGRLDLDLPWEKLDYVNKLKDYIGKK